MIVLLFLLSAIVVVAAAIKLNQYGDVISQKSSLNGMIVGTFLIAGATSLPELTTSLTAVAIGNPDIAVGNMLGSNVFNLLILAVFDFLYRRNKMFEKVSIQHRYTASLGIILFLIITSSLMLPNMIEIFGVGLDMLFIVFIYLVGSKWISNHSQATRSNSENEVVSDMSLKHATVGFIIAAIVTFLAGSMLAITGDKLAASTGLNASFVGSFLIAASTSLPELVTVYTAFRLANYDLAIGSILGSNLFNMQLLVLTDVMYRDSAITVAASSSHLLTAMLGMFMGGVALYSLLRKGVTTTWRYVLPSLLITVVYFITSYMMF
ncbi:sodium:calcium antiporter [Bacillus solimangrovi]|uniref:Cation:proton antiporter n=1 Tax=Bacillus solimangrovi TaxID=1305675 RepID=A0A1E5LJN6_9BACI|nr:sodium:calcium antiporter [Bacillus solimangrovi]OEH94246.1 cation:proton antiporter [Bacillus solimangrovi]